MIPTAGGSCKQRNERQNMFDDSLTYESAFDLGFTSITRTQQLFCSFVTV